MCHILFIHSYVNGHLGCFHTLVIGNSAAINIEAHVSLQTMFFSMHMPRSVVIWSYGSSIFSFLRKLSTVLYSGFINLHSHQQYRRLPLAPHPFQNLLFVDFFFMVYILLWFDYFFMLWAWRRWRILWSSKWPGKVLKSCRKETTRLTPAKFFYPVPTLVSSPLLISVSLSSVKEILLGDSCFL